MDCKSLMIGDWILVEDNPTRVTGISICVDNSVLINTELYNSLFDHDVNHIPLTEEILKANGFRKDSDIFFVWEDKETYIGFKNANYYPVLTIIRETSQINYDEIHLCFKNNVHELQHALRLC